MVDLVIFFGAPVAGIFAGMAAAQVIGRIHHLPPPPSTSNSPQRRFRSGDVCYANSPYRTPQKKWKDQEARNAAMRAAGFHGEIVRQYYPAYLSATTYTHQQISTCAPAQMGPQLIMPETTAFEREMAERKANAAPQITALRSSSAGGFFLPTGD